MNTTENLYPCPACGFLVFEEQLGSYEICSICNWEDDLVQYKNPTMRGGANSESLLFYQHKWLKNIPLDINEYDGYKRCSRWRPLHNVDKIKSENTIQTGSDYFAALTDELPKYYWEN